MVELIEMFGAIHHMMELIFAVLVIFAAKLAMKRFKLAIWKKGWRVIAAGASLFIFVEAWELLADFHYLPESFVLEILVHSAHVLAFALIAIGIYLLAKSAGKLWGKR